LVTTHNRLHRALPAVGEIISVKYFQVLLLLVLVPVNISYI